MGVNLGSLVRRRVLPWLAAHNLGDMSIRNPHTRDQVRLHSFRHKGYWFYRGRREAATMELFARLIGPGDRVVEVGGHIGFISQWFARLVGPTGSVVVFEPGPNNLPYLRQNVAHLKQVELVEAGVGEKSGRATFYVEELTGQNNSFVADFDGLKANAEAAGIEVDVRAVEVAVTTIDEHFNEPVEFIKVDVEGFEWEVLQGARRTLESSHPALMVEVQAHQQELSTFARELGYLIMDEQGIATDLPVTWAGNSFWLHPERHSAAIAEIRRPASTGGSEA